MKRSLKIVFGLLAMLLIAVGFAMLLPDNPAEGLIGIAFAMPIAFGIIQNSDDARQERKKIWDQMQSMVELRKTEKRDFSPDEADKYNELRTAWDKLDKMVTEMDADEKRALKMAGMAAQRQHQSSVEKDLNKYSLKRAIQLKVEGKQLDGIEAEMHQEAEAEARENGKAVDGLGIPAFMLGKLINKRSMSATGQTTNALDQGGMSILDEKQGLIMALRPMLALSQLGVVTMGGLKGNVDLVKGTSTVAGWETEVADADATGIITSKASFSPKRLSAFGLISKQLLLQSEFNFEQIFVNDLLKAIAQAVEAAAINGASGGANPVGILNTSGIGSVVGGVDGLEMAWDHIVKLEKEVDIDNALVGSLGYLMNAKTKAALKIKKLDAGSGLFVWPQSGNELNGYKVAVSNLVPSNLTKVNGGTTHTNLSAAVFGDFSQMYIGQWGGIDLIVDPYTKAGNGQIRIVTNSWWDVFVKRAEAFAAMVDIIA
jgi:HK97 family phage major capsid protein